MNYVVHDLTVPDAKLGACLCRYVNGCQMSNSDCLRQI